MGTWCSGITPAYDAGGPGFDPQCPFLHFGRFCRMCPRGSKSWRCAGIVICSTCSCARTAPPAHTCLPRSKGDGGDAPRIISTTQRPPRPNAHTGRKYPVRDYPPHSDHDDVISPYFKMIRRMRLERPPVEFAKRGLPPALPEAGSLGSASRDFKV